MRPCWRSPEPTAKSSSLPRILEVSRSGYYDWAEREDSERSQQDRVLIKEIRQIHQDTKQAYGATKTWQALRNRFGAAGAVLRDL
jgi:putative transposase